jgi:hypothetical protein
MGFFICWRISKYNFSYQLDAKGSQHRIQRKQVFVLAKTGQEKKLS